MLKNRNEAGIQLAQKLQKYKNTDAVVLALPRGGVVVGHEIARALSLPFDIIAVRKVGHPLDPEYAIGAVDVSGTAIFSESEIASIDEQWLEKETQKQKNEAKRRTKVYRKNKKQLNLSGKTVIIVDDGVATGFTMRLAVRAVKKNNPKRIIVATPVAPSEFVDEIKNEGADEIILLEPSGEFLGAVGAHYQEFEQVGDDEVVSLLNSQFL